MVLDQAVMNVSISQLVADFDTSVTAIQGVITLYSLTMAALMITGGKIGDIVGRKRAFAVGLVVYCIGSGMTALAPTVAILTLGWSILEGVGAALVLPALAALIAGNFVGRARVVAYATIGGVAGAGIAVGPILGGWATTELTWRVVFAGEVVVGIAILASLGLVKDTPRSGAKPRLDVVGAILSAAGMMVMVLGILQASTWGWLEPKNSPAEPFGFSLTPFVVGAGVALLWAFRRWQAHRERAGQDPLVHFRLFDLTDLRAGLEALLAQNLILMGVFFVIPLYLQLVLGLDALETGLEMLPVSVMMFVTSIAGSRLATRFSPRTLVRIGLLVILLAVAVLLTAIDPDLDSGTFRLGMGALGVGMGLIASQLGNVVQSAVGTEDRSEAGGLQYTAQQLGSAIGVALVGAIVLSGLVQNFVSSVGADERISDATHEAVSIAVQGNVSFVASSDVAAAAEAAGLDPEEADAVVENYEEAQLSALKVGLLAAGFVAAVALMVTTGLPSRVPRGEDAAA
ncbi:MAG: MFS transporter [Acidimicrobiia bacterium]|nr:MFS transporter [Acidimicrobiia bacterium]